MSTRHDWQYKHVEGGFWVVCADCPRTDAVFPTEAQAKAQAQHLRAHGPKSGTLRRLFPRRAF